MFAILLLAATAPAPLVDPDTVVRCVREDVTGSISTTRRVCHTVGEWRRIRSDANDEANRIFRDSQARPNGPNG